MLTPGIPPRKIPDGPRNVWAYPPVWDADYLHRKHLNTVIQSIAGRIPRDASVVDVGCGWMPYKEYFLARTPNFIGFDLEPYPGEQFRLMRDGIWPVDSNSADVCISWQVLEHVDSLEAYFSELKRVLKPGGTVYLTTHGHFRKHAEQDFWRWTRNGLARVLEEHGLVDGVVTPIDTNLAAIASLTNNAARLGLEELFNLSNYRSGIAVRPFALVSNLVFGAADLMTGVLGPKNRQVDPSIFLATARRPA